jgi:hypothetical protein
MPHLDLISLFLLQLLIIILEQLIEDNEDIAELGQRLLAG